MNFRDPEQRLASGLFVTATVALAAAFVAMLWLLTGHGPSTVGMAAKAKKAQTTARVAREKADKTAVAAKADLDAMIWPALPQEVTAKTLNAISDLSKQNRLKLISFRPLREIDTPEVIQLPWQVTVDGSFKDVVAFERSLEKPERKLAITLVQIAAADASTDRVTATLGLLAFSDPNSVVAKTAPKPTEEPKMKDPKISDSGVKNG